MVVEGRQGAGDGGDSDGVGLLAGFDAGQTHTLCRLADAATGGILAEAEGPGVSHLAAVGGPERFIEALETSLHRARDRASHQIGVATTGRAAGRQAAARLRAAAIGASGIELGSTVADEGQRLAAQALGLNPSRVVVTGDERTALRGAFSGGEGIVVISGTGTITVGRGPDGREHRCGGWGWLLDGAGSAMDIGRDGLALSLRMADGRAPDTPLREALWRALDLDPADASAPQRLKAMVVAPGFGPAGFARLAPVVDGLAGQGNPQAAAILDRSAAALVEMVGAVAGALELPAPPVCAMGGAIEYLGAFRQCFLVSLARTLPASRLVEPRGDACAGALAMAGELAAEMIDATIGPMT